MNIKKLEKKLNKDNVSSINLKPEHISIFQEMLKKYTLETPVLTKDIKDYPIDCWRLLLGTLGVFQLPTFELIDFLNHMITDKTAIEICCGIGTIGKILGIPATDRKLSDGIKESIAYHQILKNETPLNKYTSNFPDFVETLTANQAIEKYKPDVVIGCWVSQKATNKTIGSLYGVEEDKILEKVETYIHCGSSVNSAHYKKKILKQKHYTIQADWLFDRASGRGPSEMKIWTSKEPDWDSFPENLEFDILY